MSLVKCKECKTEVSNKAITCPNCGIDKPGKKNASAGWLLFFFFLIAFIILPLTADKNRPIAKQQSPDDRNIRAFQQSGYFKDGLRNRIFSVKMTGEVNESEVLSFARDRPNTKGQITAVYFYPKGSAIPADGITMAGSVFRANDMLYEMAGLSKWRYAYMKNLNGSETFIDCIDKPTHDLCRRK
ncbi:MAG: hypothetical protein FVQ79_00595 [Planctomycetes bacterium]|nr:hypothetical protein [Planctomycetota bacterium]